MFRISSHSALATFLGLICCLVVSPALGQSTDARSALERIEYVEATELAAFQQALRAYAELTARIEDLKQSTRVFWDAAQLDELLRQQESAAERLIAQERTVQELRADRAAQASEVARELRAELRTLEERISGVNPVDWPRIASEMNELTREIGRLDAPLPEYAPVPLEAITSAAEGSPDELYAASDELTDQEARLERELGDVRVRLADARASERVLRSESEFSFIEALLEDDGSRRTGSRGTSSERAGATSTQEANRPAGTGQSGTVDDSVATTAPRGEGAVEQPPGAGEQASADRPEAEPQAGTGFDETDSDDALSGDDAFGPAEFDAAPLDAGPSEASRVEVDEPTADPDRIDEPRRRHSSRSGSRAELLAEREETLLRELESVRSERERLIRRARELDGF